MMRKLCCVALLLTSLEIKAAYMPAIDHTNVSLTQCIDNKGYPAYAVLSPHALSGEPYVATSSYGNQFIIVVDQPTYMDLFTQHNHVAIKFMLLHECAHGYLGHIHQSKKHLSAVALWVRERAADCLASRWLRRIEGSALLNHLDVLVDAGFVHKHSHQWRNIVECTTNKL